MFERWSEHRRRWFLLTMCGVAWALFLNSFAHLGVHVSRGGVGPDATHAASILGTLAVWTVVWGALHLRLRHWAFALLFGATVSSSLVDFGVRDLAAAGAWSVSCDRGEGEACRRLATFYAAGESPVHGWLDAESLHRRACALGVRRSCAAPPQHRGDEITGCLERSINRDCRTVAARFAAQGDLEGMYRFLSVSCSELNDQTSCHELLSSGFPELRASACVVLVASCRTSSSALCTSAERRCERARSSRAGTD